MTSPTQPIEIKGKIGFCGNQRVFLGFANASTLVATSFADVLNEEVGTGYQRPINHSHSAEFRRYIQLPGSTTIPLTLNLRASDCDSWSLDETETEAVLRIVPGNKVFAQVDCQHRLGHLVDLEVPLAFMSFIRLTVEQERGIFTTINSKAKGLSGSLIDANLAKLASDLCSEVPDLYIAIRLADDPDSPWYNKLRKGGVTTGMKKTASLRMMNRAASRFLREVKGQKRCDAATGAAIAKLFWRAIVSVFPAEWDDPRRHFIAKGVGIYSLMSLGGELTQRALNKHIEPTESYFRTTLAEGLGAFDWSHDGPLNDFNGAKGAEQAFQLLREELFGTGKPEARSPWQIKTSY